MDGAQNEKRPLCDCHDEPMQWNKSPKGNAGGYWRCAVKNRELSRRYREANRERVRELARRWREANPEKARESNRRYREANLAKERARSRRWKAANPEKVREANARRLFASGMYLGVRGFTEKK